MLTREQFVELFNSGKHAEINELTSGLPQEELDIVLSWLNEINPMKEPTVDDVARMEVDRQFAELEDDIPDTSSIEEEIHARQREVSPELIQRQTPMQVSARQRAYRSNTLRKIKRHFRIMQLFTTRQAAEVTGIDIEAMARYLANESNIQGSQIGYNPELKKYFVVDPLM